MPRTTAERTLNHIESAAIEAAIRRARTGRPFPLDPDPPVYTVADENTGVARLLRHRLGLGKHPAVISARDDNVHPLFAGGQHYSAVALRLSHEGWSLNFLATYNDRRRLVFDLVDACPRCDAPVPTEEIGCAEDLGDHLLQTRDTLGCSPRFRDSPAHLAHCPARGD
ncbi:hypothetical protein OG800_49430 (plasmid) [Streptomyces sp. NBC_00445]|uniref:hypothetical protein n=1 Tax=Streptomyces sp. NBC_00445 TaxID=2975745 RepID=UPI002E1D807B